MVLSGNAEGPGGDVTWQTLSGPSLSQTCNSPALPKLAGSRRQRLRSITRPTPSRTSAAGPLTFSAVKAGVLLPGISGGKAEWDFSPAISYTLSRLPNDTWELLATAGDPGTVLHLVWSGMVPNGFIVGSGVIAGNVPPQQYDNFESNVITSTAPCFRRHAHPYAARRRSGRDPQDRRCRRHGFGRVVPSQVASLGHRNYRYRTRPVRAGRHAVCLAPSSCWRLPSQNACGPSSGLA
jgi:hypothetical protein